MTDRSSNNKPLNKPLNKTVVDRAEHPSLMEPLTLSQDRSKADLDDLVLEYKSHLANCDHIRRGDFDGRGALSESSLEEFTRFFLVTCIDQVKFMKSLVRPDQLRKRVIAWANDEISKKTLPPRTTIVLESLLTSGELPRGDIPAMLDLSSAGARRVISGLAEKGVLVSETSRTPVRLAFPATLASSWLPGLFPDK